MPLVVLAVLLLFCSGLGALLTARSPRWATRIASGGAVVGCVLALVPAIAVLRGSSVEPLGVASVLPGGPLTIGLDALSAFFLVPIGALSAIAAVYGGEYLRAYAREKSLGPPAFFFNLLVASMIVVVTAWHGLLFLMAWEVMSLSAYFLVTFEHEKSEARRAGWIYLVATHLGASFLFALFVLLGRPGGSLGFDAYRDASSLTPGWSALLFLFALIGFGAKAGFVPWHVWLPEAHPAAPSHVSAVMSGVMIKTGLYGILRVMTFLGGPVFWWGPTLMTVGLVGGLVGIALASYQRDLKRALAYSSIENVGVITVGLGVGVWGWTSGHPVMAVMGLAGGLLHIWNHAAMKGLMFLAAGSVLHGAGTKDIERLGGLMKPMRFTGLAMTLGSVAIAGLPPLNGFVSEWLIYMALMRGGLSHAGASRVVLLVAVGLVAIMGGLALACFVRLVGIVLLGEARGEGARRAHESSAWMTVPMLALALVCVGVALWPAAVVRATHGVVAELLGVPSVALSDLLVSLGGELSTVGILNATVWGIAGAVALALAALRRRGGATQTTTWACGYAWAGPRLQYTGASFSDLLVSVLPRVLRRQTVRTNRLDLFPTQGELASQYPDPLSQRVYEPFFRGWAERFSRLRWLQQGKINVYLVYIMVIVLLGLTWVSLRTGKT